MDDRKRKPSEIEGRLMSISDESTNHDDFLRHLEDAIQLLPTPEKEAYLDAVRCAPQIVQKESNPIWFFRWQKFNSWAAAESLASYWKLRKEIFGPDDYLKPMHQTGNGALSVDDIEILNTASMCILPKMSQSGKYVLWWDRERLTLKQQTQRSNRYRVFFYFLHVLMMLTLEDDGHCDEDNADIPKKDTADNGDKPSRGTSVEKMDRDSNSLGTSDSKPSFYAIAHLSSSLTLNADFEFSRRITEILKRFPVEAIAIHLVSSPNRGANAIMSSVASLAIRMLGTLFGKLTRVHIGTTMRELHQRLRDVGFDKRNLPNKIGGNWKDDKFEQFKRRRRRIEEEMFLSEEEKLKRKRQVNMIHSRQKRERRKIELEVLQEQCQELMHRNSGLRDDNKRLEDLIKRAEAEAKFSAQKLKLDSRSKYLAEDSMAQSSGRFVSLPLSTTSPAVKSTAVAQQQDEMNPPPTVTNIDILRRVLAMEQTMHEQQRNQNLQTIQNSLQLQQILSAHGIQQHGDIAFNFPPRPEQSFMPFLNDSQSFSSVQGNSNNQALNALAAAVASQAVPSLAPGHIFNNNPSFQQLGLIHNLSMSGQGTLFPQPSAATVLQYGENRSDAGGHNVNTAQTDRANVSSGGPDAASLAGNDNAFNPNTTSSGFRLSWPW